MRVNSELNVIRQSEVNNLSIGLLFFLLAVFPAVPYCGAVTIKAIYKDVSGIRFNDTTGLTEERRELLGDNGNHAGTLGEARRNAFEHAAGLLGRKLPGPPDTIRVEASFRFFEDETTVARSYMRKPVGFGPEELLHIAYPPALAEKIKGRALIDESAPHFAVEFSRSSDFYYGFQGEGPSFSIDFVALAMHEIIHGLGFHSSLDEDGPRRYVIVLERAQIRDRFYDGFDPDDVSLTNRDNGPEPDFLPFRRAKRRDKTAPDARLPRKNRRDIGLRAGCSTCFLPLRFCSSQFVGKVF